MTEITQSAQELSWWRWRVLSFWSRLVRLRRRYLPYLVWYGEEIDVRVKLRENRLPRVCEPGQALKMLNSGAFFEVEKILRDVGIDFDTGLGSGGRDWEWDYSLRGPISVTFKRRASAPERRQ